MGVCMYVSVPDPSGGKAGAIPGVQVPTHTKHTICRDFPTSVNHGTIIVIPNPVLGGLVEVGRLAVHKDGLRRACVSLFG